MDSGKLKVLFVDDDPQLLQGLRRSLYSQRATWEMHFLQSGAEALKLLSAEPFDVIVSDMRMPEMDGAILLEEVRRRHPDMVRIALSGHCDQELIMRAAGPAHQYLAKPCDLETLKSAVTRASALRTLTGDKDLQKLVAGLTYVPSLSHFHRKLMSELESPAASVERIAEIISRDIGMTAKVLQLVNSEFFGFSQKMATVHEAVYFLGLETLRPLVLSLGVFSDIAAQARDDGAARRLWNHSLVTAILARQISNSEPEGRGFAAEAFTGGLLHDIGKVVLALNMPERHAAAYAAARRQECELAAAERAEFGASHCEVGAYLLLSLIHI